MGRTWAIIEREMRRFRRSPVLIAMSMMMPIVQLVVLGYAFGGNVKHLKLAIVDQDHGVPAVRVREMTSAVASGAHTIDTVSYADPGQALTDLRNGHVNGVLTIPPTSRAACWPGTTRAWPSSRTTRTTSCPWPWPAPSAACSRRIRRP